MAPLSVAIKTRKRFRSIILYPASTAVHCRAGWVLRTCLRGSPGTGNHVAALVFEMLFRMGNGDAARHILHTGSILLREEANAAGLPSYAERFHEL